MPGVCPPSLPLLLPPNQPFASGFLYYCPLPFLAPHVLLT